MKKILISLFTLALVCVSAPIASAQMSSIVSNGNGTLTTYDPTSNSYVTVNPETAVFTVTPASNGGTTATPSVPGLPNTGFGGTAGATSALILSTGLIAVAGAAYILSQKKRGWA